jgi:hypothetical protein
LGIRESDFKKWHKTKMHSWADWAHLENKHKNSVQTLGRQY